MSKSTWKRRRLVAAIGATIWAVVCLVGEHFAGMYEPSEVTGIGSDTAALLGTMAAIVFVSFACRNQRLSHGVLSGVFVALVVGGCLAVAQALYFELYWGDFAQRMADFTRLTLTERGADPVYVDSFSAAVRDSWRTPSIITNTFLMFAVWGSGIGVASTAIVAAVSRRRGRR